MALSRAGYKALAFPQMIPLVQELSDLQSELGPRILSASLKKSLSATGAPEESPRRKKPDEPKARRVIVCDQLSKISDAHP
ncbi:MAG: hypothetical protein B7Y89_10305 [Novosphingobium sp. 32-60-15]|nr:MAG: hypothetical protein B7Y89_10305 [Novosphingobium sp. 32-60-15]